MLTVRLFGFETFRNPPSMYEFTKRFLGPSICSPT
jgi:hypothetical protein